MLQRNNPNIKASRKLSTQPMSSMFLRWLRISLVADDIRLAELHRREEKAWQYAEDRARAGMVGTDYQDWRMIVNYWLTEIDFWATPSKASREEWDQRHAHFQRKMYPVWAPTWRRYDAAADIPAGEPGYISELQAVHEVDIAVIRMGYSYQGLSDKFTALKTGNR